MTTSPNVVVNEPHLVTCASHPGDPMPGWLVCAHAVIDPSLELVASPPTRAKTGYLLCPNCLEGALDDSDEEFFHTFYSTAYNYCVHCAHEDFGVPL